MKKILRYASLVIIAITLTFGFDLSVSAADCNGESSTTCRVGERGVIRTGGGGYSKNATPTTRSKAGDAYYSSYNSPATYNKKISKSAKFNFYTDENSKVSTPAMWCIDAQYQGGRNLRAERFLVDSKNSVGVNAFDYAILYIVTGGGNSPMSSVSSSNMSEYLARNIAARAVTYTFGFYNTAHEKYQNTFFANLSLAYTWNKENPDLINNLVAAFTAVGAKFNGNKVPNHPGYSFSGSTVERAKTLYIGALQAATEFVKDYKNVAKVVEDSIVAGDIETNEEITDGVFLQKDVVHTIKVSGISKGNGNKFVINGLQFENNTVYKGLTSYISKITVNGDSICSSQSECNGVKGRNLADTYDMTEETVIEITAHFEGYKTVNEGVEKDVLKCGQSPIRYYIDGIYAVKKDDLTTKYLGTVWYSGEKEKQRYIGVERISSDSSDKSFGFKINETYLIDACSCSDLKDACIAEYEKTGTLDNEACKDLEEANCGCSWLDVVCDYSTNPEEQDEACKNKDKNCEVECDSKVEKFECCDANDELVVSLEDDQIVNVYGLDPNEDGVKACFVTKADNACEGAVDSENNSCAGVTVEDQEKNAFTLNSMNGNKYCTVSCKEDYIMTMPTAKLVNAGRYFTFKARVEGTKACYTNTIDREQYNKDMADIQSRIIDEYNVYLMWETALDNIHTGSYYSKHPSCCCRHKDGSCTGNGCCCGSYADCTRYYVSGTYDKILYTASESTGIVTLNGTTKESLKNESDGGSNASSCDGSCREGSEDTLKSNIRRHMNEEAAKLRDLQQEYNRIISSFNACSGDKWKNDAVIKYQKDNLYYNYEEEYLDKYKLVGEMDETIEESPSKDSVEEWYCNSIVTDGSGIVSNNAYGNVDADYENCTGGARGNSYSTSSINYVYCDTSGCYTKAETISDARYKKTSSMIKASYKPKTLFYNEYPSGEIVIDKADDNVALENKLPVALNTDRGIYKYTVNVKKLGEFYNITGDDNLGRYNSLYNSGDKNKDINYNCSYLVNIPTEEGWVCDFDEQCTDNCIANCQGPNCGDDRFCDGINCVAECVGMGCIYDSTSGNSILERTVTLKNLFPNGTKSYNWDRSVNDKAAKTIDEIEKGIDGKYAEDGIFESQPILSLTLTPEAARAIRSYNNDAENDGGYSNATLSCYALSVGADVYDEVACYSNFITDLLKGIVDGQNVGDIVNDVSQISESGFRTVSDNNYKYFTTWSGIYDENSMIGPSWK